MMTLMFASTKFIIYSSDYESSSEAEPLFCVPASAEVLSKSAAVEHEFISPILDIFTIKLSNINQMCLLVATRKQMEILYKWYQVCSESPKPFPK